MADVRASIGRFAGRGGRRGLLAAVAAVAATGLGKLAAPRRTEAAHDTGGSPEPLHAGVENTTSAATLMIGSVANAPLLAVSNTPGIGSHAASDGVQGFTGATAFEPAGVRGRASSTTAVVHGVVGETLSSSVRASGVRGLAEAGATNGVWGENRSPASNATGVFGEASVTSAGATVGVWGRTQSGGSGALGVLGQATAASGDTIGVRGTSFSPTGTGVQGRGQRFGILGESPTGTGVGVRGRVGSGVGVFGSCEGTNGSGVYGESVAGGNGVLGVSNQGSGVIGRGGQYGVLAETLVGSSVALRARATAGLGVYGSANDPSGSGVYGESLNGGYGLRAYSNAVGLYAQGSTRAAIFVGDVEIRGNLIRTGAAGGADAPVRDGGVAASGRIVDDGRGRLVNGRGTVTLDPAFVASADTSDYDVTVTPYGDSRGLFVAARTPTSFEVREAQGGTSTLELGYRVSARAKAAGAPGRGHDLGPGGAGIRPGDGPSIVAPEIPPTWRDAGPRPDAIPPAWRDAPMPPEPHRGDEADPAG